MANLGFLLTQTRKAGIEIPEFDPNVPYAQSRSQSAIDGLDVTLQELEGRVMQMNSSQESLTKRYLELTELRHVLRETAGFFQEAETRVDEIVGNPLEHDSLLVGQDRPSPDSGNAITNINIGFVAGVIPRQRLAVFERILFRALRGNLFMNNAEIEEAVVDPKTDEVIRKNVFIVFAHGKELISKIKKICESMGATIYPVDEQGEKRRENAVEVVSRIEDLRHVLDNTKAARHTELQRVSISLDEWATTIRKEKAIHFTMNMFNFDSNRKALIAEAWCPTNGIPAVQYALRSVTVSSINPRNELDRQLPHC